MEYTVTGEEGRATVPLREAGFFFKERKKRKKNARTYKHWSYTWQTGKVPTSSVIPSSNTVSALSTQVGLREQNVC